MKILLLEDDPILSDLMYEHLINIGYEVECVYDGEEALEAIESEILNYFIKNKKRAISNEELIQNLWKYEEIPSDSTLRVYIKTLRKIIGKEKIKTIRGLGYYFE